MRKILCSVIIALLLLPAIGALAAEKADTKQPEEPAVYLTERSQKDPNGGWKIGDTLLFGSYEQDGDTNNGPESIEWIVLDIQDGELFLITKYMICAQTYNPSGSFKMHGPFWKTSYARCWLNNTFLQTAFSPEEQSRIPWSRVENSDKGNNWEQYGGDTVDKVFLLSAEEATTYFASNKERVCLPCPMLAELADRRSGACRWYLRTPGRQKVGGEEAFVYEDGSLDLTGDWAVGGSLRPAIHVTMDPAVTSAVEKPQFQTYETVFFGEYEQDNITENGPEPIEWFVLDERNGDVLLLSRYGLEKRWMDTKPYEFQRAWGITWETSELREWLNDSFLRAAFSADEQSGIIPLEVSACNVYPSAEGDDRLFLLSEGEVEQYLKQDRTRGCIYTPHAANINDLGGNDLYSCWWLRSACDFKDFIILHRTLDVVAESDLSHSFAVRPALWVNAAFLKAMEREDPEAGPKDEKSTASSGSGLKAGDPIFMGHYEQDGDEQNGPEPVEWTVLDVRDGEALVISRKCLECLPFHAGNIGETTWETSTLRAWLNSDFAGVAFSKEELSRIRTVPVSAEWNPHFRDFVHDPGSATEDSLFLLDISEVEQYLNRRDDRICMPSALAVVHGMLARYNDWSGEQEANMTVSFEETETGRCVRLSIPFYSETVTCSVLLSEGDGGIVAETEMDGQTTVRTADGWRWWLRTPGLYDTQTAIVFIDGTVIPSGETSDNSVIGVRPAMWIDFK